MDNTYLAHHGILGMRWGIRRYQNKDGSLTELGKKRLAQYTNRNAISGARSRYYSNKTENVNKAAGAARGIIGTTKRKINDRERAAEEAEKQKIRDSIDLSSMSDEELRAAINRLQMEKQYKDLSMSQVRSSPEAKAGKERVGRLLDNLDSALAVGASAVALAGALASLFNFDIDDGDSDSKKSDKKETKESKKDSENNEKKTSQQGSSGEKKSDKKSSGKVDVFRQRTETDDKIYGQDPLFGFGVEKDSKVYGLDPFERKEFVETYDKVYGQNPLGTGRSLAERVGIERRDDYYRRR